ncbi:MAG: hypothetical protein ACOYI2_11360 [Bacillota bacterium]|jgi:uncharacterized protein YpmB
MQRKICLIIIGYIMVLSIVGVWFAFQKGSEQLENLEAAVIKEILPESEEEQQDAADPVKDDTGNEVKDPGVASGAEGPGYWEEYRSYEESKKKLTEVKTQDKLRVLNIIRKNLTKDDMRLIVTMVKDGVTPEEQGEIKDLLRRKLNEQDRNELKAIILNYL